MFVCMYSSSFDLTAVIPKRTSESDGAQTPVVNTICKHTNNHLSKLNRHYHAAVVGIAAAVAVAFFSS